MKSTPAQPAFIVRTHGGRFAKGVSANPSGMAKGTRRRIYRALDELAEAEAVEVLAKSLALAKDGDVGAARMILRRAWPIPRGRLVEGVKLPPMNSAADAVTAMGQIAYAVSEGTLTLEEARDLTTLVEAFRKTLELAEIERRLAAIEKGIANAPFHEKD